MGFRDIHVVKARPQLHGHRIAWLSLLLVGLATGLVFILAVHLLPSRYELHEGDVSSQNIKAPKRVQYVSAIETKVERDKAASSVQDVFVFDPGVAPQQRNKLTAALQSVGTIRLTPGMALDAKKAAVRHAVEMNLSDSQVSQLVGMDESQWQLVAANAPRVLYEVLSEKVTTDRLQNLRSELPARLASVTGDAERALAVDLVQGYARVNYSPSPADTEKLRREAQDSVAPITKTVEKGEIVLREGDVVRATDLEKLEALGLSNPAIDWHDVAAAALQALVVIGLLAGYIWVFEPWLLSHEKMLLLIALVMLATVLAAKTIIPARPLWVYVFPISGVAMLLATLIDAQLAILVTALLGVLVGSIASDSLEIATIGLVGAVIGALGVRRSEKLYSYFIAGGMVALGNFAVVLLYQLSVKDDDWPGLALKAALCAVNGLLASTLTVGTFSLLGRLFGITTTMQLLELSDPTQPLLRRLLNEAPGTYHHSIMVGNLAERAAEKVGADPLLVRVGAYYHDVGKLVRPYFFIENQFDGKNAHDSLDPQTSARIVATHVRDGLELATRYRLPPRVKEFISEHHGTRLVSFFYQQASRDGDGEVDVSQYSYPGPKPRSKEAGIVMLADSVEAVVRSTKDHSADSISSLVRRVVDERVNEGQLDDCDLTIRDIEQIKRTFIENLQGMYHPRIEYPTSISTPDWSKGDAESDGTVGKMRPAEEATNDATQAAS